MGDGIQPQRVAFASDGVEIVGHLRVPPGVEGPRPGLVFTGPLSGVKEQVVGTYADRLTGAGFVTLALDHRHFGESGGEPRQHENPSGKLADLRDGLSFLRPGPKWTANASVPAGCASAGDTPSASPPSTPGCGRWPASPAGTTTRRPCGRGWVPTPTGSSWPTSRWWRNGSSRPARWSTWRRCRTTRPPPSWGGDEPFAYYGTERSASPGWVNRLTALTVRELITTDLAGAAGFIAPTPLLVVHGRTDAYCSPEGAQAVFDRAGGPKDILWLDTTNHIDLYDVERYVGPATDRCADWFGRHLG